MTGDLRWGVCTTAKASTREILRFAAYYLDLGAHRVWVHLDAPNDGAETALRSHPKCRVIDCDAGYWQRNFGHRPKKHQVRQSHNASRTYSRATEVDWLLHADVDEFAVPDRTVGAALAALPDQIRTVRLRPMEALASDAPGPGATAFKKFIPAGPDRTTTVAALYPDFGSYLKGGFLSHVAGKLFVRTGMKDIRFRIHNVFRNEEKNPGEIENAGLTLAHLHAEDWKSWSAHLRFRLQQGAYRAELTPAHPAEQGGVTLHAFLAGLLAEKGEAGLREFFVQTCADTPELRARLDGKGLLALHDLGLDAKLLQVFPD